MQPPRNPFRSIRHIPGTPIAYLRNPKAASSAISLMLWRAHDPAAPDVPVPGYHDAPFLRRRSDLTEQAAASLARAAFFSVVRNPYARTLSAYLSKVMRRPWELIAPTFGLSPQRRPPLAELLRLIKDLDPAGIDLHFRPQHINLLHGFAPLHFAGHLERPEGISTWLAQFGLRFARYADAAHRTDAAGKLSQIDAESAALIRDIYAEDFRLFGYSQDIDTITPVAPPQALDPDRGRLMAFVAGRTENVAAAAGVTSAPSSPEPRAISRTTT